MADITKEFGKLANRVIESIETDGVDPFRGMRNRALRALCIKRGAPANEVEGGEGDLGRPWTSDDCRQFLSASAFMPVSRKLSELHRPVGLGDLTRPALLRMAKETGVIQTLRTTITDKELRERLKAKLKAIDASAETADGDDTPARGEHPVDQGAGDFVGPDGPNG